MRVALPEDVQAAAAARRAPPRHESITVGNETYDSAPKAARMLGVTRGFIHSLRRKTLWLGRPIRTAKQSVSYGHTKNPERFFSLSDLREIQKNRAAGHHPPARPALPDFEISHGTDSRTAPAAAIASTANADVPAAKPVALIGTGHVEISEADFKILDALAAKHPRPLLQTDIAEITQLCERTVGKVLKRLRERSLTRRNGKRSGEAITAEGLQQAEKKLPAD
ncbi:MAG TPA: hypothetical protein VHZ24_06790 [Pirellulales bacterium]|nr:hypothetical protein [Pirellulales bacterium]